MADQVQIRRNSTTGLGSFVAAQGELIMNTTTNALYLGDGTTAPGNAVTGGLPKSASGAGGFMTWIEQVVTLSTSSATNTFTVPLPTGYYSAIALAMATRVETNITGTGVTGFEVGFSGVLNNFAQSSNLTAGNTTASGSSPCSMAGLYSGGPNFTLTVLGAVPTGGSVKICTLALILSPPTS